MQNNSIKRRVGALENAKGVNNDVRLRLVEELPKDDIHYKECTAYILSQCEAACNSDETFDNALGAAFISVTGKNPLDERGLVVLNITDSVATQLVEILTSQGIAVRL